MLDNYTLDKFMDDVLGHLVDRKILVDATATTIFFLVRIAVCIILYVVVVRIIKKIIPLFSKTSATSKIDSSVKTFLGSLLNVGLHAILIMICLLILGFKETSLIAFFGTMGLGIGLALKDDLSNVAAGIIILVFKTYRVGELIEIAGEHGFVYKIDLFFTSIQLFNENIMMIPNSQAISNKLINYHQTPTTRIRIIIGVDYNCDLETARKVLTDLMLKNPRVLRDKMPYAHVEEYADSSINIALKCWTKNEDYWRVYKEIMNDIKATLDGVNISIPFPQMDIHMDKEN